MRRGSPGSFMDQVWVRDPPSSRGLLEGLLSPAGSPPSSGPSHSLDQGHLGTRALDTQLPQQRVCVQPVRTVGLGTDSGGVSTDRVCVG